MQELGTGKNSTHSDLLDEGCTAQRPFSVACNHCELKISNFTMKQKNVSLTQMQLYQSQLIVQNSLYLYEEREVKRKRKLEERSKSLHFSDKSIGAPEKGHLCNPMPF
jgi:hypothetical protein